MREREQDENSYNNQYSKLRWICFKEMGWALTWLVAKIKIISESSSAISKQNVANKFAMQ